MKRFLLIAAGTVGGLGAVLSVTPPQLGATDLGLGLDIGALPTSSNATQTPAVDQSKPSTAATTVVTPTQGPTKSSTPTKAPTSKPSVPTASATPTQTQSAAPTVAPTPIKTATPTPTPTPTPTVKSINGTFTGPVVDVSYGNVQVQITVTNGKITDAQALIAPTGKNDKYTRMALPKLKQQTLAAQSTNIQGASGASYTTYGWRKSLQGAMAKAGL
jgi:uncharacterized protein with FMN-binding domain